MPQHQLSAPILLEGDAVRSLQRIPLEQRTKSESWLQELLFRHPQLLPVHDIEPVFEGLLPLAREVPTGCGPLDLLFVNTEGFLTLVETKLWRNPEARRGVVAQLIDYAKDIARWSYQDLCDAVLSATKEPNGDPLLSSAQAAHPDLDEAKFIDAVTRNLSGARFLLLIVGDGIHEGVEHMAEFLQQTPHLGFTLGLIEIGLYRVEGASAETLLVQPRTLARTKEITRAVIEIKAQGVPVTTEVRVPVPDTRSPMSGSTNKLTQDEFLRQVAEQNNPAAAELVKWVIENVPAHNLRLNWGRHTASLMYDDAESGCTFGLGLLIPDEGASFYVLADQCKRLGLPDKIWKDYFDGIVALIPGAQRKHLKAKKQEYEQVLYGSNDDHIPLRLLAPQKENWFKLIDETTRAIRLAMESR